MADWFTTLENGLGASQNIYGEDHLADASDNWIGEYEISGRKQRRGKTFGFRNQQTGKVSSAYLL